MREPTEQEKQQDARLMEILTTARQRYLAAGGDPQRPPSGREGDDYLTVAERQEALVLMRKLAGVTIENGVAYCQGRSWRLPESLLSQLDRSPNE